MAFAEDLSVFFDTDGFAVSATLAGGAVRGIFDAAYELGAVGMVGMATTAPVFTLATSDVPASPAGASLVVNGSTFTVVEHQADGTGISLLLLERAS